MLAGDSESGVIPVALPVQSDDTESLPLLAQFAIGGVMVSTLAVLKPKRPVARFEISMWTKSATCGRSLNEWANKWSSTTVRQVVKQDDKEAGQTVTFICLWTVAQRVDKQVEQHYGVKQDGKEAGQTVRRSKTKNINDSDVTC
ncbi:hypothetical protein PHMEG_00011080 [Phytophthora megakarya]|uniref:Uncharacterized protein n=1 Tax=Phytophthora megakarya TaxID=4795 RepID=A0A225WD30_9STRA|nr:hypothetical protein PHMEG_00011080 [Phytophthora megakarya]